LRIALRPVSGSALRPVSCSALRLVSGVMSNEANGGGGGHPCARRESSRPLSSAGWLPHRRRVGEGGGVLLRLACLGMPRCRISMAAWFDAKQTNHLASRACCARVHHGTYHRQCHRLLPVRGRTQRSLRRQGDASAERERESRRWSTSRSSDTTKLCSSSRARSSKLRQTRA